MQLLLNTEVPSEDICAQGCCSCALTGLIVGHGFGLLWLPSFLAVGSVNLAETVGLTDIRAFLACSQALLPRPAVTWSRGGEPGPVDVGRSDMHRFLAFPNVWLS